MKKIKLTYWIATGIFAAFMAFTAIPDIIMVKEAEVFMAHLGYPAYLLPFIGVAKLLGSIAILVPNFPKVKEWAYAGLCFDLVGATYSQIATDGFQASIAFMLLPFVVGTVSYLYNRKYYGTSQ
jgi:hypothetical protein